MKNATANCDTALQTAYDYYSSKLDIIANAYGKNLAAGETTVETAQRHPLRPQRPDSTAAETIIPLKSVFFYYQAAGAA